MIYYQDENLFIRSMKQEDIEAFSKGFTAQGWHAKPEVHEQYLKEQADGTRLVFVAEYCGEAAGYTTLYPLALEGPFKGKYPEISDFCVLEKFQRNGIGNRIMDAAEKAAAGMCDYVSLGVGLHYGYGTAQRMYIKRGYIPDVSGVWYQNQVLEQYTACCNDDDLVLYLSKKL